MMVRRHLNIFVRVYGDNQSREKANQGVVKLSVNLKWVGREDVWQECLASLPLHEQRSLLGDEVNVGSLGKLKAA